jgi:murein L,D-transpeptidase YcbB/YkuD
VNHESEAHVTVDSCIFLLGFAIIPVSSGFSQTQDEIVARIIQEKLSAPLIEGGLRVGSCQISSLKVLPELYKRRDFHPIWVNSEYVEELMEAIQGTYEEGLNPNDYYLHEIRRLQKEILSGISPSPLRTVP